MGFSAGGNGISVPKAIVHTLSLVALLRNLILSLFRLLGLSELTADLPVSFQDNTDRIKENPPESAILIREYLPVQLIEDRAVDGSPETCAVCLQELEVGEEIRCLPNCQHMFHRGCLDRWMDYDQEKCPLCRTHLVPRELEDEFNQRLHAATLGIDFFCDYASVLGS